MKRILSIVAAIALLVTFMVPAFAADPTITITSADDGELYKAYKIFDVTKASDTAMAYTYESATYGGSSAIWKDAIVAELVAAKVITIKATAKTPTTTGATVYNIAVASGTDAVTGADASAAIAAILKADYEAGHFPTTADASATAADGSAAITVTDPGYYFVTTTQGSFVVADTTDITVADKENTPDVTKTIFNNDSDVKVGDTVTYLAAIKLVPGVQNLTFYDLFPTGVNYNNDAAIYTNEACTTAFTAAETDPEYTITNTAGTSDFGPSGNTIGAYTYKIAFDQDYLNTLTADTTLYVKYTGTVNTSAVIGTATDSNLNTAKIGWGKQMVDSSTVNVNTGDMTMTKVDEDDNTKLLANVHFSIYDAETAGNLLYFLNKGNGVYELVPAGTTDAVTDLVTTSAGTIQITHLDEKTYWWEETATNDGYNLPDHRFSKAIDVSGEHETLTIENSTGTELPATGGIGTIIFVTLGSIAVLAAGIFLISNKRISKEEL